MKQTLCMMRGQGMEIRPVRPGEAADLRLYRGLGFVPTGERRTMASDPSRAGIFMTRAP
jgi:hypothetical protein